MDNKFRNVSFTTENMEAFMKQYHDQANLLPLYLDKIRNGYELTEEMLQYIERFDDKSKMKLIREYNRCTKIFAENLK
jgi:hypothetical protein